MRDRVALAVSTISALSLIAALYLQVDAVRGGRVTPYGLGMFNRAEYYFLIARGWFYRALEDADEAENDAAATGEKVDDAIRRVKDIARESLKQNPGDPATWMLLARAQTAVGNRDDALQAYTISNALAPYSAVMAEDRHHFRVWFMADPESREQALAVISPEAIRTDLEAIRGRFSERIFELYDSAPAVRAFLDPETEND